ncbi:MAG: tRNA lysidine(34) synthetase TilS [Acidobacteriota bacterium]
MRSIDLSARIRQSARRFLPPDARIALALSGGVDSVVLLHLLATLRSELALDVQAVHVNHGLSPNADAWERFCSEACAVLGVRFSTVAVGLAREPGESLEAQARKARYSALAGAAAQSGARIIAIAQHADDQAETVLLQLLRGAAAKGLAAMPEWRSAGNDCWHWRPLLQATRNDIADHALRHHLRWIEDESNADPAHKRNFLRAHVLPRLEDGFPGYRSSLARAAAHAAVAAQLLDQLADLDAGVAVADDRVALAALRNLGALRAGNLLRWMLAQRGLAVPPSERLAEFIRQAFEASQDRLPALELGGRRVLRAEGGHITLGCTPLPDAGPTIWQGESVVPLPHGCLLFNKTQGSGIRAAMIPASGLSIRSREGGERLRVAANRPERTLKNLLQEAGIPATLRSRWPLIAHAGKLVAVPGIGIGVDWQCPPDEPGWTFEWRPGVSNSP